MAAAVRLSTVVNEREWTGGAPRERPGDWWLARRKPAWQPRNSEACLRLMVASVKEYAVLMLDPAGLVSSWNAGAELITGYRADEILGRHLSCFYPLEAVARGEPEAALRSAAAAGGIEEEGWRVRVDGGRYWARAAIAPVRDERGLLIGYSHVTRDATAEKDAEEHLRTTAARFAERERLTRTGSWSWNVSAGEFFLSEEQRRLSGLDPGLAKLSHPAFLQSIHPEERRLAEETLDRAAREKTDCSLECRIVAPDGSITHVRMMAHPVLDDAGDLVEIAGATTDETERCRVAAVLEEAREELRRLKGCVIRPRPLPADEPNPAAAAEDIVGSSSALRSVLARVAKVAATDSTVLITGETGTGKELVARAVHKRSRRSERPFVGFNCAGIPPSLIASELFGHEKGAFTGAQQRRLGRFELAEGGTIFLDEIGELPAETQIALLRVIQEREFERVGGSKPIPTDVRLIAATNRNLQDAVAAGTFRLDLFYRLNVFPIEMPPLRERKEDIPMLIDHFVRQHNGKSGAKVRTIDPGAVEMFRAYHWPGNIRELQNVIERSLIVCDGEAFSVDESWLSANAAAANGHSSSTLSARLLEQERKIIESALAETRGRVAGRFGAASLLGVPSSTLESKIKALDINKYRFKAG
ncbi:MAG TPA: sigma 54-interacting transcriptional regulator [Thermoanaerobaculia bacterium]